MMRDEFEKSAQAWWPEINLDRKGKGYRSTATHVLWEGFLLGRGENPDTWEEK